MEKQEISAILDNVQKSLETLQNEDVSFLFFSSDKLRGVINGSVTDLAANIVYNMARYPIMKDIFSLAMTYYYKHEQELLEAMESFGPSHEITSIKES